MALRILGLASKVDEKGVVLREGGKCSFIGEKSNVSASPEPLWRGTYLPIWGWGWGAQKISRAWRVTKSPELWKQSYNLIPAKKNRGAQKGETGEKKKDEQELVTLNEVLINLVKLNPSAPSLSPNHLTPLKHNRRAPRSHQILETLLKVKRISRHVLELGILTS